jgi:hypothetical protein
MDIVYINLYTLRWHTGSRLLNPHYKCEHPEKMKAINKLATGG